MLVQQYLNFKNRYTLLRHFYLSDTSLALNMDASLPGYDFIAGGTIVTPILHVRQSRLREGE